jgi:hypothetical protein
MACVEDCLVGTWRHSHEEDDASREVFRPASHQFPRARGRTGYEFRADHTGSYLGISPRDGTAAVPFSWELRSAPDPEIVVKFADGRQEVLPVASCSSDQLVVHKKPGSSGFGVGRPV